MLFWICNRGRFVSFSEDLGLCGAPCSGVELMFDSALRPMKASDSHEVKWTEGRRLTLAPTTWSPIGEGKLREREAETLSCLTTKR